MTLALLLNIFACTVLVASGPVAPEVAAFSPLEQDEMVDHFTGDFHYAIPLMEVPGPNGGYPLSLTYASGISPGQEASWVGLGWTLSPGAIVRQMRGIPDEFEGCGSATCDDATPPDCTQQSADVEAMATCDVVTTIQDVQPNATYGLSLSGDYELFGADSSVGFGVSTGLKLYYDNYRGFGVTRSLGLSGQTKASGTAESVGLNFSQDSLEGSKVGAQASLSLDDSVSFDADASFDARRGLSSLSVGAQFSYEDTKWLNVKADLVSFLGYAKPAALPGTGRETLGSNIEISFKGGGEVFGNYFNGEAGGFFNEQHLISAQTIAAAGSTNPLPAIAGTPTYVTRVTQAFGLLHLDEALTLDSAAGGSAQDRRVALDFNRERDGPIYDNTPNLAVPILTNDLFVVSGRDLTGTFRAYRNDTAVLFDPRQESIFAGGAVGIDIGGGEIIKVGVNATINGTTSYIGRWHGGNGDALLSDARNAYADPSGGGERTYFKFIGEMTASSPAFTQAVAAPLSAVAWQPTFPPQVPPTYFAASATDLHAPNGSQDRMPRAMVVEAFTYKDLRENYNALPELAADYLSVCGKPSDANSRCKEWYRRDNHIAAFRITTPSGLRYIYGIAVYNTLYEEHKFAVDRTHCRQVAAPGVSPWCSTLTGLSPPGANQPKDLIGFDYATEDGFLEVKEISPYPTSYLLTAIIGTDYIDAVRDVDAGTIGPSDGDYGYWVRFRYSRDPHRFKWRTPFLGASLVRGPENGQFINTGGAPRLHDKAYFTFGERESWYLASVETASHKAYLCADTKKRTDSIGASERGQSNQLKLTNFATPWRLDSVRLYTKAQLGPNSPSSCEGLTDAPAPLSAANLEYDFSLMPGTPDTDPRSAQSGRLTLKKVWFSHLGNTRGSLSPYVLNYDDGLSPGDPNHEDFNPSYADVDHDRWGSFQHRPNQLVRADPSVDAFPPLDDALTSPEQTGSDVDRWSSAWDLRKITEPSGRIVNVDYEADDYAYVQDKPAMRLFPIASVNAAGVGIPTDPPQKICPIGIADSQSPASWGGQLSVSCGSAAQQAPKIFFKLDQPITCAANSDCIQELKTRYLGANGQAFFKIRVALKFGTDITLPASAVNGPIKWQTISGYAQIIDAGLADSSTGWVSLAWVKQQYPSALNYHPFAHAAWQYLRLEQPELIHETSLATAAGDALTQALGVMNLADMIPDLIGLASGVYPQWAADGWGGTVDLAHSYIRLQDPYGLKKGGGARVKRIRVSDDWAASTTKTGHDLVTGYEYSYRLPDGRSSGVASYEPMTGADDNPLHTAKPFADQVLLSSNYNLFAESPNGEAYYPAPSVGYSRVTRHTLASINDATTLPEHPSSIGPNVYEYYTARDFPVRQVETDIDKRRNPQPQFIPIPLLGTITLNSLAASQGYVTVANDMHGKLKRVTSYEYLGDKLDPTTHDYPMSDEPVKSTQYNYRSALDQDGSTFNLNNTVAVIDPTQSMPAGTQSTMGENADFAIDLRLNRTESWTGGLNMNIDVFLVAEFPVPIPVPVPNFGYSLAETKTAVTSRYIHRSGILDSVDVRQRAAHVTTQNLQFDPLSGTALLTSSDNEYGKPVYHYQMPARWSNARMGGSYHLLGRTVSLPEGSVGTLVYPQVGQITACEEVPRANEGFCLPLGTELAVRDKSGSNGGAALTLFRDSNLRLAFQSTGEVSNLDLADAKIIRAGDRNLLTNMTDSIHGLSNPLEGASTATCIEQTREGAKVHPAALVNNVLDATHTSFSDQWADAAADVRFSGGDNLIATERAAFLARDAYARGANGIFRPLADYLFVTHRSQSTPKVDLRTDGSFTLALFGTASTPATCDNHWVLERLHKRYSAPGFEVDRENAIHVPSAYLYGEHGSLAIAAATNAHRDETANEIGYESFEAVDASATFTAAQTGEGNLQFAGRKRCVSQVPSAIPSVAPVCLAWKTDVSVTDQIAHTGHKSLMLVLDASFSQPTLNLVPGKSYVISAWMSRGAGLDARSLAGDGSHPRGLRMHFGNTATTVFQPSGPVIEGWQRIEGTFTASAAGALGISLELLSGNGTQEGSAVYFDDIRLFPESASLQTYVYDHQTLRLLAALDENNFASLFSYSPDGKLELVRRETVHGVLAERDARLHLREQP